ncbi:MAG: diaminopimelate epimerase [Flavobacteriales bacterium]|jgi:diaminopimelate epimerase
MLELNFSKYHGAGNDFILINNLDGSIDLSVDQIQLLCDRNFGIGSDGLILIESCALADYSVNFYNPDGSQSFCGNGSRCAYRMAMDLKLVSDTCTFLAFDGLHQASSQGKDVSISMSDVKSIDPYKDGFVVQTGSPHFVKFCQDLDKIKIVQEAHSVRYDDKYKEKGINVNFVLPRNGEIALRTYERGVEAETLACGTGVTAAALVYAMSQDHLREVKVHAVGGDLKVGFKRMGEGFCDVWLTGPAQHVYHGNIKLA